ncbi:MAG: cytochrome c3 family protein [Thermodesulfobacteriota bacterium]
MKKVYFLLIFVVLILLAIIAFHRYQYGTKKVFFAIFPVFAWESIDQPVLFNHLLHTERLKLSCAFCHRYVENHRAAGIPNIEICRICHSSEGFSQRPEALKVFQYVKENRNILWKRMYELPRFVVFPHWVHIRSGVDCSICHGFTGSKERPIRMVDRNYMEGCLDCHEKRGANIDCYTCHSS